MINAFNQFPASHIVRIAAGIVLAAMLAFASADASSQGRDGSPWKDCGSVTDGHGATVSGGRAGSISTRLHERCGEAVVQSAPRQEKTSQPAPAKAPKPAAAVPILPGQVSVPDARSEIPSALSGNLGRASATVVTGGVLIWFLHSSLWASLLVLGVPIWRHVDLLPVVSNASHAQRPSNTDAAERQEDLALARVLDSGRAQGAAHGASKG